MSSEAVSGFGTLLKVGDGAMSEAFTTIAEVKSITGPSMKSATIDVTNHSSPSAFREFIASLIDAGTLTFSVNFLPDNATHDPTTGLVADLIARVKRNYQLVWSNVAHTIWQIAGIVTDFGAAAPIDNVLSAAVTIKITSAPVFL